MSSKDVVQRELRLIEAALKAAADWLPASDNPQYVRGAIAALSWILGDGLATAPVSGDMVAVTVESVRREVNLADDVIHTRSGLPVHRSFAVGAQCALLWVRGRESSPPISIG